MREGTGSYSASNWPRVGRRIQVRRARLGLSQNEINGVTRTTVSRVERGQPIGLDALARIEGALGFDEAELVNEAFGEPGGQGPETGGGGDTERHDAADG